VSMRLTSTLTRNDVSGKWWSAMPQHAGLTPVQEGVL
jgi:hypothetical protein